MFTIMNMIFSSLTKSFIIYQKKKKKNLISLGMLNVPLWTYNQPQYQEEKEAWHVGGRGDKIMAVTLVEQVRIE